MPSLEITPIHPGDYTSAAALFVQDYLRLCKINPVLSTGMADTGVVENMLAELFSQCPGLAARRNGELLGYMGWYLVPDFRSTSRQIAYVPEFGHAAHPDWVSNVYQALYQKASEIWTHARAQGYAITLLAHNQAERDFWFWNGFGLLVVDAIRPAKTLEHSPRSQLAIRKATAEDSADLYMLDEEHCQHYTRPPVFMSPKQVQPATPSEWLEFFNRPGNAAWMAWDGDQALGFIRFDACNNGGSAILEGESSVFISGAYIRPEGRRRGTATAILNAALKDYKTRGFKRCTLDFESVNPQASAFWLRYFKPVAYSLLRILEWLPDPT